MTGVSDDQVLAVARAHGTLVAAAWSGRSRSVVVRLRKEHDGYSRGRGHPSRAEMAAMLPRLDCPCPWCAEVRSIEARKSAMRYAATRGRAPLAEPADREWRDRSLCRGLDVNVWFPKAGMDSSDGLNRKVRPEAYDEAKAICSACPARTECLEYAITNGIEDGCFGGLDPSERRQLRTAAA